MQGAVSRICTHYKFSTKKLFLASARLFESHLKPPSALPFSSKERFEKHYDYSCRYCYSRISNKMHTTNNNNLTLIPASETAIGTSESWDKDSSRSTGRLDLSTTTKQTCLSRLWHRFIWSAQVPPVQESRQIQKPQQAQLTRKPQQMKNAQQPQYQMYPRDSMQLQAFSTSSSVEVGNVGATLSDCMKVSFTLTTSTNLLILLRHLTSSSSLLLKITLNSFANPDAPNFRCKCCLHWPYKRWSRSFLS